MELRAGSIRLDGPQQALGGYDDGSSVALEDQGHTKTANAPELLKYPQVSTAESSYRRRSKLSQRLLFAGQILLFGIIVVQFIMLYRNYAFAAAAGGMVDAAVVKRQSASAASSSTSNVPDYYVTKPELLPGT